MATVILVIVVVIAIVIVIVIAVAVVNAGYMLIGFGPSMGHPNISWMKIS